MNESRSEELRHCYELAERLRNCSDVSEVHALAKPIGEVKDRAQWEELYRIYDERLKDFGC